MELRSQSEPNFTGSPDPANSIKPNSIKLGRRPSFQFKETKEQTRSRLAHDLVIEDWVDAEGGMGAILRYPDRVGVKVPAAIWDNWKPANYLSGGNFMRYVLRDMPIYLMWFLRSNRIVEELTVREDDDLNIAGRHFIIETVDKEGALFLVTQFGQSDLVTAFAVTGYDAVCFPGNARYRLAGQVKSHTQYVGEMPRGMLENWVYPQHIPVPVVDSVVSVVRFQPQNSPAVMDAYHDASPSVERGSVVRYHKTLASPSNCSYQVILCHCARVQHFRDDVLILIFFASLAADRSPFQGNCSKVERLGDLFRPRQRLGSEHNYPLCGPRIPNEGQANHGSHPPIEWLWRHHCLSVAMGPELH